MADNVTLDPGPNPSITYKSDDVGSGVQIPYIKLDKGEDGASSPITDANPMPIEAAALPLPSGAATEATLSAINTKITNPLPTSVSSLPLPTGAATEATLSSIDAKITNPLPVSASALPLPSGAATEATLSAINTKITNPLPVSASSLPLPTGAATEATLSALNAKVTACDTGSIAGTVSANCRDGAGNSLASTTGSPDTTDRGLITKAIMHASDGGVGTTTPLVAGTDTPNLFDAGLVTRALLYTTDGVGNYRVSSDTSGRITTNSRTLDGSGNSIASATGAPTTAQRGLIVRNIAYNYDSGTLAHFRVEGNSLYGTTYVTEKSATGVNKSFNTGNSDTGTQRVVLAANQPTVRDSSGNAVASATTTPGASDRGLTTRSFTYTHDADGVKIGSGSAAVAYNSAGLNVRSPSDVFMGSDQPGPLVAPHGYYFYSSRTTTTGSTTTVINTTVDPSTACRRGDKIRIASGSHAEGIYQEGVVSSVSSSAITLQFPLLVAPPTSRAIYIYKPLVMTVDSSGQQLVLATPSTYFPTYPVYANKFFTESGSLGFASISGAYATIATTSTEIAIVICVNQTDVPLLFSFDSGSTDAALVMPAQTFTMPAIQNGGYIGSSMDIQVKDIGTAAASGSAYYFGYYF